MRTLFAHPLRRLIPLFTLTLAISLSGASQLPRPIGNLSDYGAVLDRHGRERIDGRIASLRDRYSIDLYILASWENPFPDIDSYADAVFDYWGLNRGRTLLAVFLRSDGSWDVRIRASDGIRAGYARLEEELEDGVADLVYHRRIEEAMLALCDTIERILSPTEVGGAPSLSGFPTLSAVALVLAGAAGLAVLIHRRICPRCGRILRLGADGVYYCRRCGFRRHR